MSVGRWRLAAALVAALAVAVALLRFLPHRPLSGFVASSTAVYAEGGELLRLTLAVDEQYRLWTPLAEVSPDYLQALQWHEDRHFRWHPGVNPMALARAAFRTGTGDARQGGSTITMQLARMLYRLNTRTVPGKLRQIAAALWLEARYPKDAILEAYVNLVPYGGNVQGVGAASLVYFGKPAARLTFAEALALAVIPQAPRSRGPRSSASASLAAARQRLAQSWAASHAVAPASLVAASQPLQIRTLQQLPHAAPHLVAELLGSSGGRATVHSSVDLPLQRLVERRLGQYIAGVRPLGVNNAAALLVDARTMSVKALVGSADFNDDSISGQVNGVAAKRSPGSALKPFIYGLAFDQGIAHTQSILKDAPTSFGVYAPENFDGAFVGPISVHDALIASRNIPAIVLSARLSQPSLYQFLQSAGVSRMASEEHYGLALALGGGEVTMEELAGLYGILANEGIYAPVRHDASPTAQAEAINGVRLLSSEATFMVRSILADNPRPDGLPNSSPRVAWKTGTSWGFRDAWTAGVFGPYVLVVWVGNFDGSSNPAFVGAQVAAPLFFRIVDAIRASNVPLPDLQWRPPAGVARVEVCAASGDLPNAECPRRVQAWYMPGKSPVRVSTVHRRVVVDARTQQVACAGTPARFLRSEVYEYWPSDLQKLFAQAGMPRRRAPEDHCAAHMAGPSLQPPAIVSPVLGASYELRQSRSGETLQLTAVAGSEIRSLYWFADGAYVGTTRPSEPLAWEPGHAGEFMVSVVDDRGATASRPVRVGILP